MSIENGFVQAEIKEKYPKVYEKIKEYVGREFEEIMKFDNSPTMEEGMISLSIGAGWRGLIYFFDENGVYMNIKAVVSEKSLFHFSIEVYKSENIPENNYFKTRMECEYAAIQEAFKILENKL